ncbi:hypothetical protein A2215_04265 [Candidatus Berkelbacteria bacterium RIFOXYA2_FULL_43_10]|uniref:Uncharacterized protein n=1 Tax=Candidatus Berkelbacteria bacterium RIFOXYA2_FULL_43_10 TaxID=1797472 RepID=A0A1F5E9H1_9BACT|nr:MAG: hypothetical protein A2215_04265 [Candidatus Berkelbacteria bacterium RIFOXYA2_FULL_43_10]
MFKEGISPEEIGFNVQKTPNSDEVKIDEQLESVTSEIDEWLNGKILIYDKLMDGQIVTSQLSDTEYKQLLSDGYDEVFMIAEEVGDHFADIQSQVTSEGESDWLRRKINGYAGGIMATVGYAEYLSHKITHPINSYDGVFVAPFSAIGVARMAKEMLRDISGYLKKKENLDYELPLFGHPLTKPWNCHQEGLTGKKEFVEQSIAETISFLQKLVSVHPGKEVYKVAVYDEFIDSGATTRNLIILLRIAAERIGIQIEIENITERHPSGDHTGRFAALYTTEGLEGSRRPEKISPNNSPVQFDVANAERKIMKKCARAAASAGLLRYERERDVTGLTHPMSQDSTLTTRVATKATEQMESRQHHGGEVG